jgi:hypothetical protein
MHTHKARETEREREMGRMEKSIPGKKMAHAKAKGQKEEKKNGWSLLGVIEGTV